MRSPTFGLRSPHELDVEFVPQLGDDTESGSGDPFDEELADQSERLTPTHIPFVMKTAMKTQLIGKVARTCVISGVVLGSLAACSGIDALSSADPVDPTIYDGAWNMNVREYKQKQWGPSVNPAYSGVNWTCGDGKPFSIPASVSDGVLTADVEWSPEPTSVSSNSRFRFETKNEDRIKIYKGNFATGQGSIELRKNRAKGCVWKFDLVKT